MTSKFNVGDSVIINKGILKGQTAEVVKIDEVVHEPDYLTTLFESKEFVYTVINDSRPEGITFYEDSLIADESGNDMKYMFLESVYARSESVWEEGIRNRLMDMCENADGSFTIDINNVDANDYIYLREMAGRIPGEIKVDKKGKNVLYVAVGDKEARGLAHFHVFRSKNDLEHWRNGACILFKYNQYFDHSRNAETLNREEMIVLVHTLKSKPKEGLLGDTYWQYLIQLWNMNQPDFALDLNLPMPDYDYDTIKRYKE